MKAFRSGRFNTIAKMALTHLIAPIALILLIGLFFHSRARLEFDGDEGLNLMRGLLIDQGYALYDDIWSDQPPVYPNFLALAFRLIGYKVGAARFLSMLFSSLIAWGIFQILREISGRAAAVAGVVLLVLLPEYLRLSVSIMVGLPALSLAVAALAFQIFWHRDRRVSWLVLSALLLAISIQTKLFTAVLAPVFAVGVIVPGLYRLRSREGSWKEIIRPALIWGLVFGLAMLTITLVWIRPENLPMLFTGHLAASSVSAFQGAEYDLSFQLRDAGPILFLAVVGTVLGIRDRKWLLLYPVFWLVFGFIFLLFLHPIWYHHQLLVTIPAAIPAAYALVESGRWIIRRGQDAGDPRRSPVFQALAVLGLIFLLFAFKPPDALSYLNMPPTFATTGLEVGILKERLITTVIEYAPDTTWIVTDKPMIAFRARLPVPPEIAVLSRKRLETGAISEEDLIRIVREYRPEQVLIGRFEFPRLVTALENDYSLESFKEEDFSLYIRNDLLDE